MTHYAPAPQDGSARKSPTIVGSIGGGIGFVLVTMSLLVAVSYPVYAAAFVGVLVAAVAVARISTPALARELHGRVTELDVPGIGTVQIRVSAR
jgi:ABC-type enterobactin transport system permease subunit